MESSTCWNPHRCDRGSTRDPAKSFMRCGDVGVTVQPQEADGQAAQRCHDAGCVPGSDQRLVFLVGNVADPVELVVDLPVAEDPGGQGGRVGRPVAGDEVDDLDRLLALLRDRAADLRDLGRAGELDLSSSTEILVIYSARELRISSAVFVQAKGRGFSFQASIQARMSASRAWTDLWTPRRIFWSVR